MSEAPEDLVKAATAVRENAVAPYSNFKVGSALRTDSGTIFAGCNVENATLGLTVCAERVALWKALSEGQRTFTEIAVVTAAERPTPPCGACRQLLWEFCGDIPVYMVSTLGKRAQLKLSELVPYAFDKRDL
jgi:cytidine deaminase